MDSGNQYEVYLLSAIHMLLHAWKQVKETTIANSFRYAGLNSATVTVDAERTADGESENPSLAAALLASSVDLNTYQSIDDNVSTCWEDSCH